MPFRTAQKRHQQSVAAKHVTQKALAQQGTYRGKPRPFCIADDHSDENLFEGFRSAALNYFDDRGIGWHAGSKRLGKSGGCTTRTPSNHLCCSQTCCVNFWFGFQRDKGRLEKVLRGLGFSVAEVLPIGNDKTLRDGAPPLVGFEWIGQRNYLREGPGNMPVNDESRMRGKVATSADLIFRFRREDDRVQVVLGEWKYTEHYPMGRSLRYSRAKTDRLGTYGSRLRAPGSPFELRKVPDEALFYAPFDQLMRLQLLAIEMERARELDADIVSVAHFAPRANRQLMRRITSPQLAHLGATVHDVWRALVKDRFEGLYVDDQLLPLLVSHASDAKWAQYVQLRYGAMSMPA